MNEITKLSEQVAKYYRELENLQLPIELVDKLVVDYQNRVMDEGILEKFVPKEFK